MNQQAPSTAKQPGDHICQNCKNDITASDIQKQQEMMENQESDYKNKFAISENEKQDKLKQIFDLKLKNKQLEMKEQEREQNQSTIEKHNSSLKEQLTGANDKIEVLQSELNHLNAHLDSKVQTL